MNGHERSVDTLVRIADNLTLACLPPWPDSDRTETIRYPANHEANSLVEADSDCPQTTNPREVAALTTQFNLERVRDVQRLRHRRDTPKDSQTRRRARYPRQIATPSGFHTAWVASSRSPSGSNRPSRAVHRCLRLDGRASVEDKRRGRSASVPTVTPVASPGSEVRKRYR
jgi:hypothetical protein